MSGRMAILCVCALATGGCDRTASDRASQAQSPASPTAGETATAPQQPQLSPTPNRPQPASRSQPIAEPRFHTENEVQTTIDGKGDGPYQFTATWHVNWLDNWTEQLASHRGQPNLRYLEVGVFEGRSLLWMFDNVLTHPSTRAVAVDIFDEDYEDRFDANLRAGGVGARVQKIKEPSRSALKKLAPESFDVIYIDGSHTMDDVLADAVLAFDLLKTDGLLIFDDYRWGGRTEKGPVPKELRPGPAIDAFITAHRNYLEVVHRGYQVFVRKRTNPCAEKHYCSLLGPYTYDWRKFELREIESGKLIELTEAERLLVEDIGRSKQWGDGYFVLTPEQKARPGFAELVSRLGLKL